ncbi:hypothetical protein J4471_04115 [Candidatus Woesearchaeota archaeon]|nr:hypothetical protein [Candidatus Woesearchaeota archaeon]
MTEAQKRFVMALAFIVVIFSLYVLLFDQKTFTGSATRTSPNASWLVFWLFFPAVLLVVLFAVITLVERNRANLMQTGIRSQQRSRKISRSSRAGRSSSRSRRR